MNKLFEIPVLMIVAFVVGIFAGIHYVHISEQAKLVEAANAVIDKTAKSIPVVVQRSNAVEASIDVQNNAIATIKSAVHKRITTQKEKLYESNINADATQVAAKCPTFTLDIGTVRLLNAAREGTTLDTDAGSDEALSAASTVEIDKLLDNDLEVVRLYLDLAKRHDQLVDDVETKLRQQAEQGGK